jgi:translation initiation factor 2B subunit (eIF-2B alpha/beta/delta family)
MGEYFCDYCKDTGKIYPMGFEKDCSYCKQVMKYYHTGTYEAINVIEAWGLNFSLGNVIKYVARAGRKTDNPIEDLEKAKWYIEREIEKLKQK